MTPLRRAARIVAVAAATASAAASAQIAPPAEYRTDHYRAPTPTHVPGALTVDTDAARALFNAGAVWPIFVKSLKRSTVPPHPWLSGGAERLIPGGVWLPNVGIGDADAATIAFFRRELDALHARAPERGYMFYCYLDCWVSWNAAKRALELGYAPVVWYPGGVDGWTLDEAPTEATSPVAPPAQQEK